MTKETVAAIDAEYQRLLAINLELLAALKAIMACFDAGQLCRNIENDGCSDWALKAMPALSALSAGMCAIKKAEARP